MSKAYYTIELLADPTKSVGFLVKRCGAAMSLVAEREFASRGFSFAQWVVLMQLRYKTQMSPTELSETLGQDMGGLTRVIDTLKRNGLVQRRRSLHNRRAVEISITPEGRRAAEDGLPLLADLLNQLVEPFAKSEVDILVELLQRLLRRLELATMAMQSADALQRETAPHRRSPSTHSKAAQHRRGVSSKTRKA